MLMAAKESAGLLDYMPPEVETGEEEFCGEVREDDFLTMDLDQFLYILDEDDEDYDHLKVQSNIPEETRQSSPEETSFRSSIQVECPPHADFEKNSDLQSGFKPIELNITAQVSFQAEATTILKELPSAGPGSDVCCTNRGVHHPEYDMQGCSAVSSGSSLADDSAFQVTDCRVETDPAWRDYDTKVQCGYMNYDINLKSSADASQSTIVDHANVDFGQYGDFRRNCSRKSDELESNSHKTVENVFLDSGTSRNATSMDSVCQSSDGGSDWYYNNTLRQCNDESANFNPTWDQNYFTLCSKYSQSDGAMGMNVNRVGFRNESASCSSRVSLSAQDERADGKCQRLRYSTGHSTSPMRGNYFSDADGMSFDEAVSAVSLMCSRSYIPGSAQTAIVKAEAQDSMFIPMDTAHQYAQTSAAAVSNRSMYDDENSFYNGGSEQFATIPQNSMLYPHDVNEGPVPADKTNWHSSVPQGLQKYTKHEYGGVILACKRARHSYEMVDGDTRSSIYSDHMDAEASELLSCHSHSVLSKLKFNKEESQSRVNKFDNLVDDLSLRPEVFNPHTLGRNAQVEDDSDVCIIKEVRHPVFAPQSVAPGNSLVASQHAILTDSLFSSHHTNSSAFGSLGMGGSQPTLDDERSIFRVAMQDLSQPRSEASPPDGFLAVPLLRHQRIALSWMIQKETNSLHCSGGILADDQGLGKTVSTIALILKEMPSSSRVFQKDVQKCMLETFDLDEDDDGFLDKEKLKSASNSLIQLKGRPAAGTLVVCPTSVLRQWADELQNKVTSNAKLSVLVYHGSNRTKDPSELAKYDVVLTTYSIVSMEVPKQPFADEDDYKNKDQEGVAPTSKGASSSKRCNKKSLKKNKEKDSILPESLARPLGKVGWFRVILDEAQSIKNHKTQVARACWGLRAKRRWCLSGTPIQNTIDDLYSYFRFLRYEPYSVYKTFCLTIKFPISKNPTTGYKKLRAVLKTIMLRRTKGTLLDGKPIITLPPKLVELKKVEFSWKERDFYSILEADSRAQFAEYAAAGTVKQNYVNILLMLLRLRQACDHPLLVRKYDSGSAWKSSVEMLKKLPQERQQSLLNCLEGSMAICGICNDPPEDSVVSICGHVFCNQCISDHLTMDDRKCPATNCKDRLSESSVFSKVTLINSLSVQSGQNDFLDWTAAELAKGVGLEVNDGSYESSKLKAAIEVLEALRPQHFLPSCNSTLGSSEKHMSCLRNSSDTETNKFSNDTSKDQNSNGPVKVFGEKAIVFSQWTRMLDLLEAHLKKSSIQYRRLDGTMSVTARDKAVKEFNNIPEVTVMIMSLKAASLGLNMVAACHVILLDLWWNPTTEDQAVDRAHRIGQTRPVKVLRLTVKDTVEDRILALQENKRDMVASAFGEDENGSSQNRLTVEDLKYLFMA